MAITESDENRFCTRDVLDAARLSVVRQLYCSMRGKADASQLATTGDAYLAALAVVEQNRQQWLAMVRNEIARVQLLASLPLEDRDDLDELLLLPNKEVRLKGIRGYLVEMQRTLADIGANPDYAERAAQCGRRLEAARCALQIES